MVAWLKKTAWLLVLIWIFSVAPMAVGLDEPEVDRQIDEITAGPEYEWLRGKHNNTEQSQTNSIPPKSRDVDFEGPPSSNNDCGYHPTPAQSIESSAETDAQSGSGCSRQESTPCQCDDVGFPSCACEPIGLGNGIGMLGYLIAAILLVMVVFFIVWAAVNRDHCGEDTEIVVTQNISSPDELRLSELPKVPTDQMMSQAQASARRGDFKSAVGWCYLCGIGKLHRLGQIDLRRSTTNLEIIDAVRSKGGAADSVSRLIDIFEILFFGDRQALEQHWHECRQIVEDDV